MCALPFISPSPPPLDVRTEETLEEDGFSTERRDSFDITDVPRIIPERSTGISLESTLKQNSDIFEEDDSLANPVPNDVKLKELIFQERSSPTKLDLSSQDPANNQLKLSPTADGPPPLKCVIESATTLEFSSQDPANNKPKLSPMSDGPPPFERLEFSSQDPANNKPKLSPTSDGPPPFDCVIESEAGTELSSKDPANNELKLSPTFNGPPPLDCVIESSTWLELSSNDPVNNQLKLSPTSDGPPPLDCVIESASNYSLEDSLQEQTGIESDDDFGDFIDNGDYLGVSDSNLVQEEKIVDNIDDFMDNGNYLAGVTGSNSIKNEKDDNESNVCNILTKDVCTDESSRLGNSESVFSESKPIKSDITFDSPCNITEFIYRDPTNASDQSNLEKNIDINESKPNELDVNFDSHCDFADFNSDKPTSITGIDNQSNLENDVDIGSNDILPSTLASEPIDSLSRATMLEADEMCVCDDDGDDFGDFETGFGSFGGINEQIGHSSDKNTIKSDLKCASDPKSNIQISSAEIPNIALTENIISNYAIDINTSKSQAEKRANLTLNENVSTFDKISQNLDVANTFDCTVDDFGDFEEATNIAEEVDDNKSSRTNHTDSDDDSFSDFATNLKKQTELQNNFKDEDKVSTPEHNEDKLSSLGKDDPVSDNHQDKDQEQHDDSSMHDVHSAVLEWSEDEDGDDFGSFTVPSPMEDTKIPNDQSYNSSIFQKFKALLLRWIPPDTELETDIHIKSPRLSPRLSPKPASLNPASLNQTSLNPASPNPASPNPTSSTPTTPTPPEYHQSSKKLYPHIEEVVEGDTFVWHHLEDAESSLALKLTWSRMHSNKYFLKSVNVDSRNILFGSKWSPNVPLFAQTLSFSPLIPAKSNAANTKWSSEKPQDENRSKYESSECMFSQPTLREPKSVVQQIPSNEAEEQSHSIEYIPPAQFDWSSSGLTNPLEISSLEKEILETPHASQSPPSATITTRTTASLPINPSPIIQKILNAKSNGKRETAIEKLSAEVREVVLKLPNIRFMKSKGIMFPLAET